MESERLVAIWQAITTWVNEALAFFYQPSQLAQLGAVLVCGGLALAADPLFRSQCAQGFA